MICLEGKSETPHWRNAIPFRSLFTSLSQSRTLKGLFGLTWRPPGPYTSPRCLKNYRDTRTPSGVAVVPTLSLTANRNLDCIFACFLRSQKLSPLPAHLPDDTSRLFLRSAPHRFIVIRSPVIFSVYIVPLAKHIT